MEWIKCMDELPRHNQIVKIRLYLQTIDDEVTLEEEALYNARKDSFVFLLGDEKVGIDGNNHKYWEKSSLFNKRLEKKVLEVLSWQPLPEPPTSKTGEQT